MTPPFDRAGGTVRHIDSAAEAFGGIGDFDLKITNLVENLHGDAVISNSFPPITHTVEMDLDGEHWHQLRDLRHVHSTAGSIELQGSYTFRCRRRLAPLVKRRRTRLWLLDRGWLRIIPPMHMRIDFPVVEFTGQ